MRYQFRSAVVVRGWGVWCRYSDGIFGILLVGSHRLALATWGVANFWNKLWCYSSAILRCASVEAYVSGGRLIPPTENTKSLPPFIVSMLQCMSLKLLYREPVKAFLPVAAVCTLSLTSPAYAYIDPGTAGIILQAIIGGSVAALALFANFWCNIKAFFAKLFGHKQNSNPEDAEDKE